jgi:excisionase family DNA binding protein
MGEAAQRRFLTLSELADELNVSQAQAYALVRSGSIAGIRVGGRNQWRIERSRLEAYIERAHEETRVYVENNPLGRAGGDADTELG